MAARGAVRGQPRSYPTIRKMLADPEPPVRLRVALALASSAKEKEALPVLVELMAVLNPDQLWPRGAAPQAGWHGCPGRVPGDSPETRKNAATPERLAHQDNDKSTWPSSIRCKACSASPGRAAQSESHRPRRRAHAAEGRGVGAGRPERPRWRFDVPTYPSMPGHSPGSRAGGGVSWQRVSERISPARSSGASVGAPHRRPGLPNDHVFVVMQNRLSNTIAITRKYSATSAQSRHLPGPQGA